MSLTIEQTLREAKAALKAGNPVAASRGLVEALNRFPNNARLTAALGDAQKARTGLPARPFAPPHLQRVMQIRQSQGAIAAIEEMRMALLLDPASAVAHGLLGSFLLDIDRPQHAIVALRAALKRNPADTTAGVNLSIALRQIERPAQAAEAARAVLTRQPDFPPALVALAKALLEDGRPQAAVEVLVRVTALLPNDAQAHYELGLAYSAAQRFDLARTATEAALRANPRFTPALNELGNMLLSAGDFESARAQFETAISINPTIGASYYNLTRAIDVAPNDPLIGKLHDLAAKASTVADKVYLYFALAKAHEDAGQVDESFKALAAANATRRAEFPFDREQEKSILSAMKERLWSPDAVLPLDGLPPPRRRPIFILGMMRSGTTLTEQIVSSHSQVYGAGELDYLGKVARDELLATDGPLDRAAMMRIRHAYLERIDALPGDQPVLVDKMPNNFALVGAIRAALPEARILHMRRDPIAVCWSIYQKHFAGSRLRFANDLEDIAWFYDQYSDLMEYAAAQAPGCFMDVDYAQLTRDPEPMIRKILAYCDLPFEEACLSPQDNTRAIRTASYKQVRSGIYQGSTSKWRGFEPYLKPLVEHFRTSTAQP